MQVTSAREVGRVAAERVLAKASGILTGGLIGDAASGIKKQIGRTGSVKDDVAKMQEEQGRSGVMSWLSRHLNPYGAHHRLTLDKKLTKPEGKMTTSKVARELGCIVAEKQLEKKAALAVFDAFVDTAAKLGKAAGLKAFEVEELVKKAEYGMGDYGQQQQQQTQPIPGMSMKQLSAAPSFFSGENLNPWNWGENPAERAGRRIKSYYGSLGQDVPKPGQPGAPGAAGGGGEGAAGGKGPLYNAQTRKLFTRAGYDPKQERGTMDALQALRFGAGNRVQRGKELNALARSGTGFGV